MDTLRKRYFYKLSTNLVGFLLGLITMGIVPKGLGPKAYGDFNFLTNFFTQVSGFLDMGTSTCFYTNLSRRQNDYGLVSFYFYFSVILSAVMALFVLGAHLSRAYQHIWPDQNIIYIYAALLFGILSWFVTIMTQMMDAWGLTTQSEVARMIQRVVATTLVLILFVVGWLNLENFFFYHYFLFFFLGGCFLFLIWRNKGSGVRNLVTRRVELKKYIPEFYHYSHPIFVFSTISFVVGILDRWILQLFGGSVEQGFYSLSFKIGEIIFMFTSAMTPLLMREFSISFASNDNNQIRYNFNRYVPLLFSVTAYFTCFSAVRADILIELLGGAEYKNALAAVIIMSFYPIFQVYGQMTTSVFFATDRTRQMRNIRVVIILAGLPVTYFMLAPAEMMGLDAGATGLAIKMVGVQFFGVNVLLYFVARILGFSFWSHIRHQITCVGILVVLALAAVFAVDSLFGFGDRRILDFVASGFIYSLFTLMLLFISPTVLGLKRDDLRMIIEVVKNRGGGRGAKR
ncbi:MAG: oligosaccharide flippase family protein [Deltaproteobacteria bacterium]|nr:oligosaccharide flippase family protein [Candidatus Zymogenaceae bacterium]